MNWNELKQIGYDALHTQKISPFVTVSSFICVLLSGEKVFIGKDLLFDNQVAYAAEECAFLKFVQEGYSKVDKILILNEIGEVLLPSSKHLVKFLALHPDNVHTKILTETEEEVSLGSLLPSWWGTFRRK